jgi:hypothetical protein
MNNLDNQRLKMFCAEFVLESVSPISHGGLESSGNIQLFRTLPFMQKNGEAVGVPVISGNSLRAKVFRKEAALRFLQGLRKEEGKPVASKKTVRFLASGGSFEERGEKVDIEKANQIRENIPMVGLLGGAISGVTIPGIMNVDFGIPIVEETLGSLPEWAHKYHIGLKCREVIETVAYTRKSEDNNPAFSQFVEKDEDSTSLDSNQMIYHSQTLKSGVPIYWSFSVQNPTPIEYDLCIFLLELFKQNPRVGGVGRVGHGKLKFVEERYQRVDWDGENVVIEDQTVGQLYSEFVKNNQSALIAFAKMI